MVISKTKDRCDIYPSICTLYAAVWSQVSVVRRRVAPRYRSSYAQCLRRPRSRPNPADLRLQNNPNVDQVVLIDVPSDACVGGT